MFFETLSWVQKEGDGDKEMHMINLAVVSIFHAQLQARGLCVDVLQGEVYKAVEFVWKYFLLGQESQQKIWHVLHTCLNSSSWSSAFMLCEFVFSLLLLTSRVKQMFFLFKTIKPKCKADLQACSLNEIHICVSLLVLFNANAAFELSWKECSTACRVSQKPC